METVIIFFWLTMEHNYFSLKSFPGDTIQNLTPGNQ